MANTSLVKTIMYKSLSEGVYKDVVSRTSSFYYFLGKTLSWDDENNPPLPVDSFEYERDVRNEIITVKEIRPSDVAFVITRRDWVSDTIYDMYDDQYTDQIVGINVISGGTGYIDLYDTQITITGGGGTGAAAVVSEVVAGAIAGIVVTNRGTGYTSAPVVTITSPSGSGCQLSATMGIAPSGAQKLEDANFYVVTDDYNVYKCLDNNNGARSIIKPTGTQLDTIRTSDGYVWKFMYNIPINLRNKFYTDTHIPVVSALTNHFYSNGTVDNIFIANKGKDYTSALVSVTGDGYREADPLYINGATVVNEGTGYTAPTLDFSPPFGAASPFAPTGSVNLGQIIYNASSFDYYEVVTPGAVSSVAPTHRSGVVLNGNAALKYVGTKLKGTITTRNDKNLTEIVITSPGASYVTPPSVVITDPTGTGAQAVATVGTSTIQSVLITNGGSGYVAPVLSVSGGDGGGAVLQAIQTGGVITQVNIITPGSGYVTVPSILVEDSVGVGAILTPVLSGSPVQSITLTHKGSNYTDPTVTINGTGVGAAATATIETGVIDDVSLVGSIREVAMLNSGSGYLEPPQVSFTGTVTSMTIEDGGEGYDTAPTVTFVGGGGSGAVAELIIDAGVVVGYNIINAGSGYTSAPGIALSGGTPTTAATVTAHLDIGQYAVVKSKLYSDKVISTYVVNPGDGYNIAPTVVFGTQWVQGLEVYTNQQFSNYTNLYTVQDNGFFGSLEPIHTSTIPVITSPEWVSSSDVVTNQTVYVDDRMYKVLIGGTLGTTAPDHTTGIETNGDVPLEFIGKPASLVRAGEVATGYAILRYGAGYSVTPSAIVNDITGSSAEINFFTSKSEAKISAITEDGQITYIIIEDPGVGYTKATLVVSGEGTGGALTADLSLGAISSQQANNEILTPSGTIDAIAIVSGGYSYGVANILIEGDGSGAAATADIDPVTNAIIKINITARGEGYTYANVRVIGNGNGAKLRAIISPYGGHGKNSPDELFARSLMFYTNISTDLNQGVVVGNDYRQVGIIKNPRVFDGFERFQGSIGSACYVIQSPIDTSEPMVEWSAGTVVVAGNYVWFDGRVYKVEVGGITGQVGPTATTGVEVNGNARLLYVTRSNDKNIYIKFAKDDDIYIERIDHTNIEWVPTLEMTVGQFVWTEDRIYSVIVSGIGGSTAPSSTSGSEQNGFAVLTYVGSTKTKKRYRIVSAVNDKSVLVQSLDNDIPGANDVFIKTSSITDNFTAVTVGPPTFDKYSGQMMYIDNKQGFTPSADETITLRTIIKF